TLYNTSISFVPGLGFDLFSFYVIHEHQEKVLNRSEARLLNCQLTFARNKENGSYIHATRSSSGQNVNRSIVLATFEGRRPPPSSVFGSSPSPTAVPPSEVTNSNEIGTRNGVSATRAGVKNLLLLGGQR
ncbi:unnamed protein product, partial [Ascophyllum nodosum]